VIKGCLDITLCETGYRQFKLLEGFQELKNGFFCHRCGTGGIRLKYGD
jgi:hypothetical protein